MKKYISSLLIGASLLGVTSCKKYLDVNTNPNQATQSTPRYVLPNALVNTASAIGVTYHDYGAFTVGYEANAGGYGGWGTVWTYNYATNENNGLWTSMYNNLKDYQYILDQTNGVATQVYFNAIARIMKCYDFQNLVDEYGDVPYTEALKGATVLTPKYDKADAIYQDLVAQLNKAIADIKGANTNVAEAPATADIMFAKDGSSVGTAMSNWIKFANSLKLRILLRASNSSLSTFVNTNLTTFGTAGDGFLTIDATVNPGYVVSAGKQNPFWATYHSDQAGAQSGTGRSRIPTKYILTFYNGNKIVDSKRAALTFYNGVSVPANQLGVDNNPPVAPSGTPAWYIGGTTYASAPNALGVLKGRTMNQPLMLAAESYFLLAEAAARGFALSGSDATNFNAGITASFTYLQKDFAGNLGTGVSTASIATDVANYIAANPTSPLVTYSLNTTVESKVEAIITQKYIALNFIHGGEAWNEYRRTGYPKTTGNTDANASFASTQSQSTRTDKLPVRVPYPASEYTYNPSNVPSGINVFTSRIFWDAN